VPVRTNHEDVTSHGDGGDGHRRVGVVGGCGVPASICVGADDSLEGVAAVSMFVSTQTGRGSWAG